MGFKDTARALAEAAGQKAYDAMRSGSSGSPGQQGAQTSNQEPNLAAEMSLTPGASSGAPSAVSPSPSLSPDPNRTLELGPRPGAPPHGELA